MVTTTKKATTNNQKDLEVAAETNIVIDQEPTDEPFVPGTPIVLRRIKDSILRVPIKGTAPVIPHRWTEKALNQMREQQSQARGSIRKAREPKNAEEEAEQSCYWLDDGRPGIPATAFKAAIIGGVRLFPEAKKDLPMVSLKTMIYVNGLGPDMLVPINGIKTMREDTPRNTGGAPDLRYRYQFDQWTAELIIRFPEHLLPAESLLALVAAGGRGGVGDWRPSAPKSFTGVYGTWDIDETKEIHLERPA